MQTHRELPETLSILGRYNHARQSQIHKLVDARKRAVVRLAVFELDELEEEEE